MNIDFRRGRRKKTVGKDKKRIGQQAPFIPFAMHTRRGQKPADENPATARVRNALKTAKIHIDIIYFS